MSKFTFSPKNLMFLLSFSLLSSAYMHAEEPATIFSIDKIISNNISHILKKLNLSYNETNRNAILKVLTTNDDIVQNATTSSYETIVQAYDLSDCEKHIDQFMRIAKHMETDRAWLETYAGKLDLASYQNASFKRAWETKANADKRQWLLNFQELVKQSFYWRTSGTILSLLSIPVLCYAIKNIYDECNDVRNKNKSWKEILMTKNGALSAGCLCALAAGIACIVKGELVTRDIAKVLA